MQWIKIYNLPYYNRKLYVYRDYNILVTQWSFHRAYYLHELRSCIILYTRMWCHEKRYKCIISVVILFFSVKSHAAAPAEHDRKLARVPPTTPNEREKKITKNIKEDPYRRPIPMSNSKLCICILYYYMCNANTHTLACDYVYILYTVCSVGLLLARI